MNTPDPHRRALLAAAASLPLLAAAAQASETPAPDAPAPQTATSGQIPLVAPGTEFIYEAVVEIDAAQDFGMGPLGHRFMVPITGGSFEGPRLRGKVLAGGADRQLLRADGVKQLDALYEMQTEDGAVLTVRNHVTVTPDRKRRSYIEIQAPDGPHGWLNGLVLVGTLDSLKPARNAVVIRAFALT